MDGTEEHPPSQEEAEARARQKPDSDAEEREMILWNRIRELAQDGFVTVWSLAESRLEPTTPQDAFVLCLSGLASLHDPGGKGDRRRKWEHVVRDPKARKVSP